MSNRGVVIALALVGCIADDDSGLGPGSADPPRPELPAGVWEPFPGAEIRSASLAIDGDTLWWAATRRIEPAGEYLYDDQVWLTATSARGEHRVEPAAIQPMSSYTFYPHVIVTPSAIVTKLAGGVETLLQRFDRDGVPLGEAYALAIDDAVSNVAGTDFIATVSGGAQYFAALGSETHEIAVIDIDAAGVQQSTRLAGTPAPEDGGTRAYNVAAAARPDGSTVVAWDRGYHGCVSSRPPTSFATTFAGDTNGPVVELAGIMTAPALGSYGDSVYAAWASPSAGGSIAFARYPEMTTVIAQLGEPNQYAHGVSVVLAGPGRGVIAWSTGATEGDVHVVQFIDAGDHVQLGVPAVIPQVDPDADMGLVGVVHIGHGPSPYYAVAWMEASFTGLGHAYRVYATELYFSDTILRPAPPVVPPSNVNVQPNRLRCP